MDQFDRAVPHQIGASDSILADLIGRGHPSVPSEKAGCDRAQRGHVGKEGLCRVSRRHLLIRLCGEIGVDALSKRHVADRHCAKPANDPLALPLLFDTFCILAVEGFALFGFLLESSVHGLETLFSRG